MIGKFSITVLMQSFNEKDNSERSSFEHKVVLYKFDAEISNEQLKTLITENNLEEPYPVEGGAKIYWKPVKIIDVFEIDSPIDFENNCEVYSRFIIDEELRLKDVIEKYFSDYVWEDNEINNWLYT